MKLLKEKRKPLFLVRLAAVDNHNGLPVRENIAILILNLRHLKHCTAAIQYWYIHHNKTTGKNNTGNSNNTILDLSLVNKHLFIFKMQADLHN